MRVNIFDLYDIDELNDSTEHLYNLVDPDEELNYEYDVKTMSPAEATKVLSHRGDETVLQTFKHAAPEQKAVVNDKMKKFDHDRIVLLSGNNMVDGNHHLIAAIQLGKPIKYIDLGNPIEKQTINEEVNELPNTNQKLELLHKLMKKPLPAKHAIQALSSVISTSILNGVLEELVIEDPLQDSRDAIMLYLKAEYPEIANTFTSPEYDNEYGVFSTLGYHPTENS